MNTLTKLVDSIIKDADERIPRARIEEVASELAAQFEDARITTYVPIFLNRMIRAHLREESRRAGA
ncbi:MAG: three-helix bundle dimerization domain-containing protein [Gammaproteobacteria bacterium]